MNKIHMNFKNDDNFDNHTCICKSTIVNEHIYLCETLNEGRKLNISYDQIYNGNIVSQKEIISILNENIKKLETFTQARDDPSSC